MGIGARITAIFGLGALLLSFSMGGLSYFTARHFLLAERETAAQTQAFANALVVLKEIAGGNTQYETLLGQLDSASASNSILVHKSKVYSSPLGISESSIPAELRSEVLSGGTAATQTYVSGPHGQPQIVVGVPIPSVHAAYFEVFSLSDLGHTLRVLGITLVGTGVVTTVLGIVLGRFASRRSLRPLAGVSRAAVAIAGGRLDTRLAPEAADPDLEGLTSSFNTMVDQLQARIEREARFNSDVSHELRSPLTTLSASLEVLEADRYNLPPRAQRALQLLGDDLRRFQRMVGDLLEMSRADAGSVDVFLEEVNVGELVQRAVEAGMRSLGNGAANYGGGATVISVSTLDRTGSRESTGSPDNGDGAGRAERGGRIGRVGPGPDDVPTVIEIAVEDAGPGISDVERTKVFDRFYRGSASGRRGTGTGTGLGLALVAEHVRLMHGETWVEAAPSGGARFVVTLPVFVDDEGQDW